MKVLPPSRRDSARREVEALVILDGRSAFVPQYYGHVVEQGSTRIAVQAGGQNYSEILEQGQLSPAKVAEAVRCVADALDQAHQAGFAHCDVDSSNVVLSKPHDGALLIDWEEHGPLTTARGRRDTRQLAAFATELITGEHLFPSRGKAIPAKQSPAPVDSHLPKAVRAVLRQAMDLHSIDGASRLRPGSRRRSVPP